MAYKAEQIESGALRKLVSQKQRKAHKKAKRKKTRNNKLKNVPAKNKYEVLLFNPSKSTARALNKPGFELR